MTEDYGAAITQLSGYHDLSVEQILSVNRAIVLTSYPIKCEYLDTLWRDLENLSMVSSSDRPRSVDLFLMLAAASLPRREWRTVLGALWRAVVRTTNWTGFSYWFRAIGSGLEYGARLTMRLLRYANGQFITRRK